MIRNVYLSIFAIAVLWVSSPAKGGIVLSLSDYSSDETPAEILDAFIEFSILDNVLTVSVTNATQGPAPFDINSVYFNGTANVGSLTYMQNVAGWTFLENQTADGFGQFDFVLLSDISGGSTEILPGATVDFEFTVTGDGPISNLDFVSDLSTTPPGNNPMIAVAKFVHGPQDDSAFGAVVPEPATLILLGVCSGILLLRRTGRRREGAKH